MAIGVMGITWLYPGEVICDDNGQELAVTNRAFSGRVVRWERADFQWMAFDPKTEPDWCQKLTAAMRKRRDAYHKAGSVETQWVV